MASGRQSVVVVVVALFSIFFCVSVVQVQIVIEHDLVGVVIITIIAIVTTIAIITIIAIITTKLVHSFLRRRRRRRRQLASCTACSFFAQHETRS
jgi:threonine/homoserine/homoserine lactone efflux protein